MFRAVRNYQWRINGTSWKKVIFIWTTHSSCAAFRQWWSQLQTQEELSASPVLTSITQLLLYSQDHPSADCYGGFIMVHRCVKCSALDWLPHSQFAQDLLLTLYCVFPHLAPSTIHTPCSARSLIWSLGLCSIRGVSPMAARVVRILFSARKWRWNEWRKFALLESVGTSLMLGPFLCFQTGF